MPALTPNFDQDVDDLLTKVKEDRKAWRKGQRLLVSHFDQPIAGVTPRHLETGGRLLSQILRDPKLRDKLLSDPIAAAPPSDGPQPLVVIFRKPPKDNVVRLLEAAGIFCDSDRRRRKPNSLDIWSGEGIAVEIEILVAPHGGAVTPTRMPPGADEDADVQPEVETATKQSGEEPKVSQATEVSTMTAPNTEAAECNVNAPANEPEDARPEPPAVVEVSGETEADVTIESPKPPKRQTRFNRPGPNRTPPADAEAGPNLKMEVPDFQRDNPPPAALPGAPAPL